MSELLAEFEVCHCDVVLQKRGDQKINNVLKMPTGGELVLERSSFPDMG